jgi:hypothetical protein
MGGASEPGLSQPDVRQPVVPGARLGLLTLATRTLAGRAADADDAALLTLLGPVVVPALGEIAALYTVGTAGAIVLAGAVPAESAVTLRLRGLVEQQPMVAAGYAAIIAGGQPARLPGAPPADAPRSPRATGLVAEIMAPLGSGAGHDALLVIGTTDPNRQYDDDDLATVEVLAALLEASRTAREARHREVDLREQIEATAQAGRELAHRLNNDLTMPVGVMEVLLDRGGAGSDLQEMIEAAAHDLTAIEEHIKAFHEGMRTRSSGSAGPQPPGARPGPF